MSSLPEGGQPEPAFPTVGAEATAAPATPVLSPADVQAAADANPSGGTRYFATALIAAAIGAAAGYYLKPPPVAETDFVNFDAPSTPPQVLGEGWPGFELLQDGITFSWCAATRCTLNISSTAKHDRLVRARLVALHYEGAPDQTMTVYLNGTKIGSQPVPSDKFVTLAFPASRQYWLPGINALSFEFAYAKAPREVFKDAVDARTLAAMFDWVEIDPK